MIFAFYLKEREQQREHGADLDSTPVTKLMCACRDGSQSRKSKAAIY